MFALLSVVAPVALLLCLFSLLLLHAMPTGFRPIRNHVSNRATRRFEYVYGVQGF